MSFVPPDLRHVDLPVVHFDEHVVVVDKPSGLLAVPGRGPGTDDCVAARIAARFVAATGPLVAHRLDMDTSGLMVLGLDPEAQRALSMQFEGGRVHKRYEAVLSGTVAQDEGIIELAFRLDVDNRPHQIYDPVHGKLGRTRWRVLERGEGWTRVAMWPLTGRTHQLRVHAAHARGLGCPILGDRLYGNPTSAPRLLLHACELGLEHPATRERVQYTSPATF